MNRVDHLKRQLEYFRNALREEMVSTENQPQEKDLFFMEGYQEQITRLEQELAIIQAERDKEVFEVRLIGNQIPRGAIPLQLLANLADPLNKLFANASYNIKHKIDAYILPHDWIQEIDLRLVKIASGSSRLIITGNTTTDLAGDSPLQDSFEALFDLLNDHSEAFTDKLHTIGGKAGKGLSNFLSVMQHEHLSCEITWVAPNNKKFQWEATPHDIAHLHGLLEDAGDPVETKTELSGRITLLADTGRIELRTEEGTKKKVAYGKENLEQIEEFTIHQWVTIPVIKIVYNDPITGREVTKYRFST